MMTLDDLNDEERTVIEDRRKRQAIERHNDLLIEKSFKIAYEFDQWSRNHEERLNLTFSTFVNLFGYQEEDAQDVYEIVKRIYAAAYNKVSQSGFSTRQQKDAIMKKLLITFALAALPIMAFSSEEPLQGKQTNIPAQKSPNPERMEVLRLKILFSMLLAYQQTVQQTLELPVNDPKYTHNKILLQEMNKLMDEALSCSNQKCFNEKMKLLQLYGEKTIQDSPGMSENFNVLNARARYGALRALRKTPPATHTKLSDDVRVLGIKGTDYEITLDASQYNNVWEMKFEVVSRFYNSKADREHSE